MRLTETTLVVDSLLLKTGSVPVESELPDRFENDLSLEPISPDEEAQENMSAIHVTTPSMIKKSNK